MSISAFRLNFATQAVLVAGLLFIAGAANRFVQAQSRSAQRFEVVSIKPCNGSYTGARNGKRGGEDGPGGIRWDPAELYEECQPLSSLISDAYMAYADGQPWTKGAREESPTSDCCGLRFPRVSRRLLRQPIAGSPSWIDSARYTIDAKAETPATQEMMRGPMMQAALEDRFKLRIHRENEAVPVYELIVAEGGPKLEESKDASCISFNPEIFDKLPPKRIPGQTVPIPCGAVVSPRNGTTEFPGTTIGGFCLNLSSRFDRDVIDKTGLSGFFDIRVDAEQVKIPVDDSSAEVSSPGDLPRRPKFDDLATFRAFQAAMPKIGLRLRAATADTVFIVIDHVERPSRN